MADDGSTLRRYGTALLVVVVLVGLPALVAVLVLGSRGATPAVLGVVGALLVSTQLGRSRVLPWLPIAVVLLLVGAAYAETWGWIALLGLLGLVSGLASMRGLLPFVAVIGLLVSSAAAFGPPERVVLSVAAFAGAALWAHLLLGRTSLPDVVARYHVPVPLAVLGAVLLATAAVAAALLSLELGLVGDHSLPMFLFLLAMPTPGVRVSLNARRRLEGTALGLLVALPLSFVTIPAIPRMVAAVLVLAAAVVWTRNLRLSTAATSLAVILLLDPAGAGLEAGETRLLAVASAAVVVVSGFVLLVRVGRRRGLLPAPAPADDSDAVAA